MKQTEKDREILTAIQDCIGDIQRSTGVSLTPMNILEYINHFGDDPKGLIEDTIDSYMDFEIRDIEIAISSLVEVYKTGYPEYPDYQIKKIRQILSRNPNSLYEVDPHTMYSPDGRTIELFHDEDFEENMEKAIELIVNRTQGMELVSVTEQDWFDEGGASQVLVFANKKATRRVWNIIDSNMDAGKGYMATAVFLQDMIRFPEDYVLFYNSAV